MKSPKQPFVLFFVGGMVPTAKELQTASKLRARIGYRNASVVSPTDAPEPCDGVAGEVPATYKKFPTAEAAIAAFDARLDEAAKTAETLVDKPPVARERGPGTGAAPAGFENLPGGNGAVGAPAAATDAGKPVDDTGAAPAAATDAGKPVDDTGAAPANPTEEANRKPPAWGSGKPK